MSVPLNTLASTGTLPQTQPVAHSPCQTIQVLVAGIVPSCCMELPFPTASGSNCCPSTAPKQLPLSITVGPQVTRYHMLPPLLRVSCSHFSAHSRTRESEASNPGQTAN